MTNIKSIIGKYQGQMESAGLLRRPETMRLSDKVAAMPTSFTKARLALQEYSRASVKVQESPMAVLFEYTLPKLEPLLIELGEEKAEEIVSRLCGHGKAMIEEHGVEGAREHLEELFKDLPYFKTKINEQNGIEEVIEAYRIFDFEEENDFLGFIVEKESKGCGHPQISYDILSFHSLRSPTESFFIFMLRFRDIKSIIFDYCDLDLAGFSHLKNMKKLTYLKIKDYEIPNEIFNLFKDIRSIETLDIAISNFTDRELIYLKQMVSLKRLYLESRTNVSNAGINELKKAIPGLQIHRY